MKDIILNIHINHCQVEELTESEQQLIEKAKKATLNAYAKYSGFRVGAALLLKNGQVVIGANQENAAYPSGLCAERTAIFAAQASCPDQPIVMLAIAAQNADGFVAEPVTPCGACRQVILEIEERYDQPVEILLYGTNGVYRVASVRDLLPLSFVDASMH